MARASYVNAVAEIAATSQGYAGGVNIRDSIQLLQPNEARIMENGILDERGAFTKRLGVMDHGPVGAGGTEYVLSMYTFYRAGTNPQVLVHTTAGRLLVTNDPSVVPVVWTAAATGLSTTVPLSFETFNSFCYFGNGVDSYARWDGTAYTTFPSAPKGKYHRLYKDAMFISGITGLPDRVYQSAKADAETWPSANWVDITHGDGDQVTALATDGLNLIIFKLRRHMIIYDPTNFANRIIDFDKGCESHFSVVAFEGELMFLSRQGICRYLGDSPSQVISGKVDPLFDPAVVNFAQLSKVTSYAFGSRVGWAIPEVGASGPTMQLEYYPRLGQPTMFGTQGTGPFVMHRMPVMAFARVRTGATEYLYGGHNSTSNFLHLFAPVGTDVGKTFSATLESGALDFGEPTRTKYLRRVRFLGRGQCNFVVKRNFVADSYKTIPLDMSGAIDTWNASEKWGVGLWGGETLFQEAKAHPDAYGRYFQFMFTDSSTVIGKKEMDIGSKIYMLDAGEWSVYLYTINADLLGVRD